MDLIILTYNNVHCTMSFQGSLNVEIFKFKIQKIKRRFLMKKNTLCTLCTYPLLALTLLFIFAGEFWQARPKSRFINSVY